MRSFRLPLNGVPDVPSVQNAELKPTTSSEKELLDRNRRDFLPSTVFLLLRRSVHLLRSASSLFLAGENVLLFPRALTWTDKTHGLV